MSNDDERICADEAIAIIMRRGGMTRRQAKAWLLEKMRQGKIAAYAVNPATDEVATIPKEVWPKVN
jgi:hypothetical protein